MSRTTKVLKADGDRLVSETVPTVLLGFDRILDELERHAEKAEELRADRARIVRECLEAGHTPNELADRSGLSPERIRQWNREAVR